MKNLLEGKGGFFVSFECFAEIEENLGNILSPTGCLALKKVVGECCGKRYYKKIIEKTSRIKEVFERLSKWKSEENWGELTFQDVNLERASGKVVIKSSFEVRAIKKPCNSPCCHFFSGLLEGFLSMIFNKEIAVIEEKCIAMGDEHCEFRFVSSSTLYLEEARKIRDEIIKGMVLKSCQVKG